MPPFAAASETAARRTACRVPSGKPHWQEPRPAHGAFGPLDLAGQAEFRDAFQELLDGNGHFQSSEVRADAAMDAEAEGGMAVFLAVNDDLIRLGEDFRVAIGRGKGEQHHLALLEGAAIDPGLLLHLSRHRDRSKRAQELLDGKWHQLRLVSKAA